MKLSGYGRREWLGSGVVALILVALCVALTILFKLFIGLYLAAIAAFVWLCLAAFFRDPERKLPEGDGIVTSPADGVVRDIELIRGDEEEFKELFKGRDMLRIGVFLSVFDVHINRAPCDMRVEFRRYKEGFFHDARDARASKENESLALGGVGRLGSVEFPVVVRQISGAIARRIVCAAQPGDQLARGFRYGMIKFGSRTELFLPAGKLFELEVKVGDRVFAGTSVMAKLVDPDAQPEGFTDTVPVVGIQKDEGPGR